MCMHFLVDMINYICSVYIRTYFRVKLNLINKQIYYDVITFVSCMFLKSKLECGLQAIQLVASGRFGL